MILNSSVILENLPKQQTSVSTNRLTSTTATLINTKIQPIKRTEEVEAYVRGRGRGRYVCERCGIRCKKPSMLKKHLK